MRAVEKEDLFASIKAGGVYFDAIFAVLYDEFAESERGKNKSSREPPEIIIYKDEGEGDNLNFFVLAGEGRGGIRISAYIKTEENFEFFCRHLQNYISRNQDLTDCTVTDYNNSYVNDGIIRHPALNLQPEAENVFEAFCCFHPVKDSPPEKSPRVRLMNADDEIIAGSFGDDPDDYLEGIFSYSVKEPVYENCGVFALFAERNTFAGYLSFYGIEKYLDVSYIYVAEKWRRKGFAGALMSAFVNYCAENGYTPYYSNADGEESKLLAEKYGFKSLGKRTEYTYKLTGDQFYEYGNGKKQPRRFCI